jgi:hypothetical protein
LAFAFFTFTGLITSAKKSNKASETTEGARVYLGDLPIIESSAYSWIGDTIFQGNFKAYAPNDSTILSNYYATPGYFMPVEQKWQLKNDISAYPQLSSSNKLHNAIFNMGLDEMVNAVEPDSTLRTGKEWPGVWTRDVSYSIILSMAMLQPEVSRISLEHKISKEGTIIQDTGSGGAWPVSSDREIWCIAAFEVYKATGNQTWLRRIYPVIKKSLETDYKTIYDESTGLVRGETSFIDWREQSHPRWMQTADIYNSEALGTNIVHAQAWKVLSEIAKLLGNSAEAKTYADRSAKIAQAVNDQLWMADKGYYGMYLYGRDNLIVNPRAETLGESLAILFDVATPERARLITEKNPTTPFGPAIFYPQIADMPAYHNNALWPFVASYWTLANAKAANSRGALLGLGSVFRPAALFATNKENFNLDNGDISTELNSSNMLWSLSGNIALTMKMLFGITPEVDGLSFAPFIPKELNDQRTLNGLRYRNMTLNVSIEGYGNRIAKFYLNGKTHIPFVPADLQGEQNVVIVMDNNIPQPAKVNAVANAKAPITPIAWLTYDPTVISTNEHAPKLNLLQWQPIEYIDHYKILRDGKQIAITNETSYVTKNYGEYQVIGVSSNGIESFASEPRSNYPETVVEMPNPVTRISSSEACNVPTAKIEGYRGGGFVETDHTTSPLTLYADVKEAGDYTLSLRYANGNGPVNTENKCAIRTVFVDNQRIGTIVMPQRGVGNWNDWGMTNSLRVKLTAGKHTIVVKYLPEDENMNFATNHALIDRLILRHLVP